MIFPDKLSGNLKEDLSMQTSSSNNQDWLEQERYFHLLLNDGHLKRSTWYAIISLAIVAESTTEEGFNTVFQRANLQKERYFKRQDQLFIGFTGFEDVLPKNDDHPAHPTFSV